jgi:hypothetical protein
MEAPAMEIWTLPAFLRATSFLGFLRKRRNMRDMRTTVERIKDVVEA